jgi:hypothetical protein
VAPPQRNLPRNWPWIGHANRIVTGLAIAFAFLVSAGATWSIEISVQSAQRALLVEREYRGIFFPPTYPPGFTLDLFALFQPQFGFVSPTPATRESANTNVDPMDVTVVYADTDGVQAAAGQVSLAGGNQISASGLVRCEPDILQDGLPSYLIFSRCRAESKLDVSFDIDSTADYALSTTLSGRFSTATTIARVRLYDGAGALLHSRELTGCVGDPPIPPVNPIYWACPSQEIVFSGELGPGRYRMLLDISVAAATEDFYYDELYGTSWPGWSEYGEVSYALALDLVDAPIPVPSLHTGPLALLSTALIWIAVRVARRRARSRAVVRGS